VKVIFFENKNNSYLEQREYMREGKKRIRSLMGRLGDMKAAEDGLKWTFE
jgi:hypothetical protein